MRNLMRLASCHRVNPEIAGSSGAVVEVEQARTVFGKSGVAAGGLVHAFRDRQHGGLTGMEVVEVKVFVTVDVGAEGDARGGVFRRRRELAGANLPFFMGDPPDPSWIDNAKEGCVCLPTEIENARILIAVRGV